MSRRRVVAVSIIAAAGSLVAGVAMAADGALDPTFDGDGKTTTAIAPGAADDVGYAIALQWDGKLLVAGSSTMGGSTGQDMSLARYNTNGTLDRTFSGDGKVTLDFFGGLNYADAVAVQLDGKILVGGATENPAQGTADDFALARYNTNGTLDRTFSGDGKVTTAVNPGASYDNIYDIALQADGKIVVLGYAGIESAEGTAVLARYNTNGTLDRTFSGDGIARVPRSTAIAEARAVAIASNGKILVAGSVTGATTEEDMAVLRYTSTGRLDPTFGGGDGVATLALGSKTDKAYGVAVAPDGKIVAAGWRGSSSGTLDDFAVVRLSASGVPDGTFGFEGIVTTDVGGALDKAHSVALQWDGKIVVAGRSLQPDTNQDATVIRYNSDGSLDSTFDGDGIATVAVAPATGDDWLWSVAVQWNGKIVGAGMSKGDPEVTGDDIAVIRLDAQTSVRTTTSLTPSTLLRRQLPKGASVRITVAAGSRTVCSVVGGKLKAVKAGTCRASISVTPRRSVSMPSPRTIRVAVSFTVVN